MALEAEVEELKRLIGRNSRNSSLPPSRDSREGRKQRPRKRSGRKQGGQQGHEGTTRELVADPDRVVVHWPERCGGCGRPVGESRPRWDPVCHQVSEVIVRVEVTEHQRMPVGCECGCRTQAELPDGVPVGSFGPGIAAAAATLTAAGVSRREVARLLKDLLGVTLSPASVEALLKHTSTMLEAPYVSILEQLDRSPVQRLHDLLERGSRCRDPKTRRFTTGLLEHEKALWTFTTTPGVPATNNAAKRALRHAVLWRKQSYGTQTDHGDRLVERLLTIRETCRLQGRRLHDYLTTAITASLNGHPIPPPIPP